MHCVSNNVENSNFFPIFAKTILKPKNMNTITENHRHRRSIRLPEYDYSSEGLYFITICVHERRSLFGTIVDGVMHLNDAGRMVEDEYHRLPDKYPHITCHEYIVMPNHFHCIIQIHPQPSTVGASLVGAQSHPQPSTVRASLVGAQIHPRCPY